MERSETSIDVKMEATEPDCDSPRSKKLLEWELSLDARDLRSHAWYHGRVSRPKAEQIVAQRDGDFLVRDCSSQPGNYVLTCRSKGQILHFVINKIVLQPETVYESVQYCFEEDGFDTVPDLITYYVGSGKPVTAVSGAKIQTPRNRWYSLSWRGDGAFSVLDSDSASTPAPVTPAGRSRPPTSRSNSWRSRAARTAATSPASPHREPNADFERRQQQQWGAPPLTEEEALAPPPKPSRFARQSAATERTPSCSDSGNGSGDSVHNTSATVGVEQLSTRSTLRRRSSSGVVIKQPKYSAGGQLTAAKEGCPLLATSMPQLPSAFDAENLHTVLLPVAENKPLEAETLHTVHALLVESGSRTLANHLTRADLRLTVADLGAEYDGCMCRTGIELAMLPHGRQHRCDLIERTECLKLLVATTIMTCDTESERAELLNKWIEVAIDAKTALGNLFGFCAIMLGLCTPQIQRLDETWHILRQKFTDSAFNFEAKLRPTLKSMNESTNPLAPNTTIPHLLPLLLLYERAFDEIADGESEAGGGGLLFRRNSISLYSTMDEWESSSSDLGLSTWYAHLNGSRHFCRSQSTFRRNAEIVLADSKIDELLLDMFRTEFHLKFLWGSRGAMVAAVERHLKFEQILGVMSEKCENFGISSSAGYS